MNPVIVDIMNCKKICIPFRNQNNFYMYDDDGLLKDYEIDQVCFGTVANKRIKGVSWFVGTHKKRHYDGHGELTKGQIREYFNWLFYESQFAPNLKHNDVDWSIEKQGLIISGNILSPLVIFLAQTHRLAYGYCAVVRSWLFLRHLMDPKKALFVAHYFQAPEPISDISELIYLPPRDEHYPLDHRYSSMTQLLNWLDATPEGNTFELFSESTYYKGISHLWSEESRDPFIGPRFQTTLKNPFIRPEKMGGVNQISDWIEQNELGEVLTWNQKSVS